MRTSKLIRFGIKTSLCLAFCAGLAVPVFAQKKLNVAAVTVEDFDDPFFVQTHGAQAAAKKINPSVKFQSESSNYDVNNQTNQMDNFIASGANLILLNAADSKGIAPAVMRAKAAGVTVVAVDVGAEGGVDATVTSNNKQAGQLDGKYVADRLKGKGQIVIVNGPPVSAVTDRVAGFLEEIKKSPDIKILSQDQNAGGSRDGGLRVMTDLLTAFPKIDAVFAIRGFLHNAPERFNPGFEARLPVQRLDPFFSLTACNRDPFPLTHGDSCRIFFFVCHATDCLRRL